MSAGKNFLKAALKVAKNGYASITSDGVIYDSTRYYDTGNLLMNAQISGSMRKGMASNLTLLLAGEFSVGKTFLMLGMVKKFLDAEPENVAIIFESEGAIKSNTIKDRGIDPERVSIYPISTIEELKNQMFSIIKDFETIPDKERPGVMFCLDSLGQLSSMKEMEDADKGHNASDMGGKAKGIKSAFRVLRLSCVKNNMPFIVTSHIYTGGGSFIPQAVISGGTGPTYAGDTSLMLTRGIVKEGEDQYDKGGIRVGCKAQKSRDTRKDTMTHFVIDFMRGLTKYSGLFEFCVEKDLIKKVGNRYCIEGFNEDAPVFKTKIMAKPEEFFTEAALDILDVKMGNYFNFGGSVEEASPVAETEDE